MYRPGDYLVHCDKCGMRRYASECRLNWKNQLVCDPCFEPRHPQDFVKAIPDDQTVPIARPDVPQTMGETTVAMVASRGATSIVLTSVSGIADKDSIGIVLDDGTVHWTYSDGSPVGTTVFLGSYLPAAAGVGNIVYLPSINKETWITATELRGADL